VLLDLCPLLKLGRLLERLEFSAHDQQFLNYLTTFNCLLFPKSFQLQSKQDIKQEGRIRGNRKPSSYTSELKDTSKKRRQKAERQHSPKELHRSNMAKRRRFFQVERCNAEDREKKKWMFAMFVARLVEWVGASLPAAATRIIVIYVESGTSNYVLECELFIYRHCLGPEPPPPMT